MHKYTISQDDKKIKSFKLLKDALAYLLSKKPTYSTYYLDDDTQTIATFEITEDNMLCKHSTLSINNNSWIQLILKRY